LLLVLVGVGVGIVVLIFGPSLTPAQLAARAERARLAALAAKEHLGVRNAEQLVNVVLPKVEGAPVPVTPANLFVHPLAHHEVVGFVPYWTLSSFSAGGSGAADVASSSELIYSSVCVGADGSLITTSGDCSHGTADLAIPAFSTFIKYAHSHGVRVLLSVQTIDPAVIDALSTHASTRALIVERNLYNLVKTYGFDGINLDIEGRGVRDRVGYVNFVQDFSSALRSSSPSRLELMVDTYPQSAGNASDFYDVAQLAHYVDRIFVMAYQMENGTHSSANSPLASPVLGWSDVQSLVQYTAVVPADKLILGLPFYGLNFAAKTNKPGSVLASDAPGARLYSDILAVGRPAKWDVASATPFTVFQQNGGWHQDWYDNPVSLALKTALAQTYKIAGVGVWAMSMEGSDTQMLSALTGESTPKRLALVATVSSSG
jgi:hypothetical protein